MGTKLALQWIIAFLRTDCALDSGEMLWEAYVLSKGQGSPMQRQQPADPSCLNGFRIYVGLLTQLTDKRWTNRLDAALARLWPRCTPTRIIGWCTDARPCDWRNHQFFVDQSVMYSILDSEHNITCTSRPPSRLRPLLEPRARRLSRRARRLSFHRSCDATTPFLANTHRARFFACV